MPIVSQARRLQYLKENHPVLHKACTDTVRPEVLRFRWPLGESISDSAIPVTWDTEKVEVIPLWAREVFLTAIRLKGGTKEFIRIDFEDPENANVIARTSRGLFTHELFFMIESVGGAEISRMTEVEEVAAYLGFADLALVHEALRRFCAHRDYEAFYEFIRSI